MKKMPDLYSLLGVPRDAETSQIRTAYKQLAKGPSANISAVDPNAYAVRFMEFVSAIFSPHGAV